MRRSIGRWAVLAVVVCLAAVPAGAQAINISELEGTTWFGLYMNGQKIGFAKSSVDSMDDASVRFQQDVTFRLAMVGMQQEMKALTSRRYSEDGKLLSVEETVDDVTGKSRYVATVTDKGIELSTTIGGQTVHKTLPPPRESLQDAIKSMEMIKRGPAAGETFTFYVFEPMFGQELEAASEVLGTEERILDGVRTKVFKVKTLLKPLGMESVAYLTESGELLEDHIGGGMITMRVEPEAVAKDVKFQNDTIVSNAAMLKSAIKNARTRDTLNLRVTGPLTEDHLFNDARQTFTRDGEAWRFEGRKAAAPAMGARVPVTTGEAAQWTKPTLYVQSDDARLIEKAREIVGDEKDALKVVDKLATWVSQNMQPTFSARLSNSLEVLDSLEGDCTEHSVLFVGLARAAGVPAREVAGLIYADAPKPGFYFHQWATVWVGEWMDVDPTFHQTYADATHIKLSEGDLVEQIRLLPVIGKISIELIEE